MHDNVTLLLTISLVLIISPFFAKIFKLPTTPIEIIFGSVLGLAGYLHDEHLFELTAELGFLYLMFIAGTEINLRNTLKTPMVIIKKVMLYLGILYAFSITFSIYFELGKIFIVLLPLISVGLVATLSKEYGKTPWLDISMTAGGIGEIISIGLLTVTSTALVSGFGLGFMKTIMALILFLVFMIVVFKGIELVFWWYPKFATALMPKIDNQEQDIRLSMGILLALISAMLFLKLELAFGAFIAGIFIPTFFQHKEHLPEKLSSFGFGFLIPVFFIHIGFSFDIKALFMDGLTLKAFTIAFAMIAMRVVASLVFIKELKLTDSILMGLSHSMPLTLLIAIATLAYHENSIDSLHYFALILASLIQVIMVMIAIKIINVRKLQ